MLQVVLGFLEELWRPLDYEWTPNEEDEASVPIRNGKGETSQPFLSYSWPSLPHIYGEKVNRLQLVGTTSVILMFRSHQFTVYLRQIGKHDFCALRAFLESSNLKVFHLG